MRSITEHRVNPCNDAITVKCDDPDPSGASHVYELTWAGDMGRNWISNDPCCSVLRFQKGPVTEAGVNGITNEVLLAILVDRLRGFQDGPFKCRENALALTKLEEAQHWLYARTRARMARGVEGTLVP